jgi:outer membrane protein TolC
LQNAVDIQAEVFEQRKVLREQGKETNLNVLDAKTELFEAQLELIRAEFEYRRSAYALGRATGMSTAESLGLKK